MIRKRVFEADLAILLPEVAGPGDWCVLPYCDTRVGVDGPSSLILIARREKGAKHYDIIGKGVGWREHLLWQIATMQHDFWVRFGSEDLLVVFNQDVFSLCDFIERPAVGVTRFLFDEMKSYMRTGFAVDHIQQLLGHDDEENIMVYDEIIQLLSLVMANLSLLESYICISSGSTAFSQPGTFTSSSILSPGVTRVNV